MMHGDSEQGEILPGWAQRRSRTATRAAPSRTLSPSPKEANAKRVERGRTGSTTSAHNLARRHRDDMKDYVTEEETLQKRSRIHHKPTRQDQRQNKGSEASMWSPNIVAPATRWAEAAHPSRSKVIYSSDVGRTLSDVDEHSELFYHQESSSPTGGHVAVASFPPDSMTPHDVGNTDLFVGGSPASSVSEHSTSPLFSALPKLLSCSTRLTRPRPSRPWRRSRFELRLRTRFLPSRTWLVRTRDFLASHQRLAQGPRLQHTLCVVCAQNRCSSVMGQTLVSARIVRPSLPRAAPDDLYNSSSRGRSSSNQNKAGELQERMKWTIRYLPKRLAATFGLVVQAARYYHAIGQPQL